MSTPKEFSEITEKSLIPFIYSTKYYDKKFIRLTEKKAHEDEPSAFFTGLLLLPESIIWI